MAEQGPSGSAALGAGRASDCDGGSVDSLRHAANVQDILCAAQISSLAPRRPGGGRPPGNAPDGRAVPQPELTGLTSGSASRLVDRLEKAGYVTRQRDEQDRRRVLVEPVPAAMQRFGEFWDSLAEDWQAMFDGRPALALVTSLLPAPLGPPSRRPQGPAHEVEVSPALGVRRGRPSRSPVHLGPKELTPRERHCTLGFPRCSDRALHGDWPF